MRRTGLFGSHLYNQIVAPLVIAALTVGVVATGVAVYVLRDLTDKWVSQVAEASTSNLVARYDQYSQDLAQVARIVAADPKLRDALARGDMQETKSRIVWSKSTIGYDNLMVLSSEGKVVASSGFSQIAVGERPLDDVRVDSVGSIDGMTVAITKVAGVPTLTAFHPMRLPGGTYLLALSSVMSDDFLGDLAGEVGAAFSLYDAGQRRMACTVREDLGGRDAKDLRRALDSGVGPVDQALHSIKSTQPGVSALSVGRNDYQVWARPINLSTSDVGNDAYLVGLVSERVSNQAARTTTNLIAMWSVVAVIALIGLGGWVARRVSDPLVELTEVAGRIADGDFSQKVQVARGGNEISTLATSFNEMTDSLRDRSESLTKKVLELATLYEMSRSLGSTLDLDDLLGSVLESALRIFDLDLGYIALRDKETGSLLIRAVRGSTADGTTDGAVRSSMSEWVVREGRPLIFNPDPSSASQIDAVTGAKAALCVPLVSSEGTIGSITVGSSDADYRFNGDDVRLLSTIANHVTIAIGNIELFTSLQEAYLATVRSLAAAVDAKDTYTRGHSERVAMYATLIAERMGLSHDQRIALEMAAYLHDIGKIGVPEEILLKPGRLDDDEMAQMRHHPLIGANILKPVAFPWAITPVVRHHHEHFDGTGYPAGLRGEEIPLLARILTVADSYEAMTADRPYREGRHGSEAVEELRSCAGTQFDPRVVECFAEVLEEFEEFGEPLLPESFEDISSEEARAIFSALVDGVFASFRRLGGPRLASNVESEVDHYFLEEGVAFRIVSGRIAFNRPPDGEGELSQMRSALRRIDSIMSGLSGTTLVDHFYDDALESFSARMRDIARRLEFYSGA